MSINNSPRVAVRHAAALAKQVLSPGQRAAVNKRQASACYVSRFIELVTRAIRPLFLCPVLVMADPVSQHNEPNAGIQAAIDRLDAAGCTRYSVTRSGQYVLHSTTDKNAYNLVGNTITVRCTRPAVPVVLMHELTWTHANRRTDGTAMQLSEVQGYELEHNGTVLPVGLVTSYTFTDTTDGGDSYRIRTVDTYNQRGPWSDYLRL